VPPARRRALSADLVIAGGRVVDPLSGFDAVADVAVTGGRVTAVGAGLPAGAETLDATGLVVAPGFIDLHSHVHSIAGHRLQAFDGVTSALDLEAGCSPVGRAYAEAAAAGRPLHYGFSASWAALRMQVLTARPANADTHAVLAALGTPGWQREATAREQALIEAALEDELADGALGVGVLLGYAPGAGPAEYLAVAALAARAGRPVFTHARELIEADAAVPIDGVAEIVRAAADTGAHMHCCHVNSTSRRHVDRVLALIDRCRAEGGRVTTEAYPYGAGASGIGAPFLAPERLHRWGMTPRSITYLPTGERVASVERLRELRASDPGGMAIMEMLREDEPGDRALLDRALLAPDTMIATDAAPLLHGGTPLQDTAEWPPPAGTVTHPRTAGTFAKTLRRHVREDGTLDLVEAVRRCSTLPALALERMCPAMRRKGRLQAGADADLVVFDLETVSDQATFADSCRPSTGFRHIVVGGTRLIRDGTLDVTALPGRALRAS
jgi:N-acyl-D-aspartate/D-glutamate deacylase